MTATSTGKRVSDEQLAHGCASTMMKLVPVAVIGQLFSSAVLVTAFLGRVASWRLAVFAGGAVLLSIVRVSALRRWRREADVRHAIHWSKAAALFGGVLWGIALLTLSAETDAAHSGLVCMVAAGLVASTMLVNVGVPVVARLMVVPILLGALAAVNVAMGDLAATATTLLICFGVVLDRSLVVFHANLVGRLHAVVLLERSERTVSMLLEDFQDQSTDWLWEADSAGRVRRPASAFVHAAGRDPDGELLRDLPDLESDRRMLEMAMFARRPFRHLEMRVSGRLWRVSGKPVHAADGTFNGFRGVAGDVTEMRSAEKAISFARSHDPLTGLPNRAMLLSAIEAGAASGGVVALLALDIDRFALLNDMHGRERGDDVLMRVATVVSRIACPGDLVARVGPDDFMVLFGADRTVEEVRALADDLLLSLSAPLVIDGASILMQVRGGMAEAGDADALVQRADFALSIAKAERSSTVSLYEPERHAAVMRRRRLARLLEEALEEEALEVHYQPLVDLATYRVVGYEALVRWVHSEEGAVPPGEFIPVAEESGLIVRLGEWVLQRALDDAASWPADTMVAVNLSPIQVREPGFVELVVDALARSRVAPGRLELEITEGVLIRDPDTAMSVLGSLRTLGVRIALDDFGTGYSSLSYLSLFAFDKLKIDRSFIDGIEERQDRQAIVSAIMALGTALEVTITAEGIETVEQLEYLRRQGCHVGQGYLLARPRAMDVPAPLDGVAVRRAAA